MIESLKNEAMKSEDIFLRLQEIQESVRLAFLNCLLNFAENGEPLPERGYEDDEKEQLLYSTDGLKEMDEEEEKEEVKLISGIINPAQGNQLDLDDDIFPEFKDLLSGEIDFRCPVTSMIQQEKREKVYQTEMTNNANELERLRNLIKELEEREMKLEGVLLEYYGLKEQESEILELQKQLKIKSVEIDMLNRGRIKNFSMKRESWLLKWMLLNLK